MSHSDTDSEGFESADDFDNNESNEKNTTKVGTKSSTNPKSKDKEVTETTDKLKALEVENDDIDDSWAWGDDDDFDSSDVKSTKTTDSQPPVANKANANEKPLLDEKIGAQHSPSDSGINSSTSQAQSAKSSAWTPWSGVVSLLSTASGGVASFTSHVSSVIESNIGVPDPMEFVQQQRDQRKQDPSEGGDEVEEQQPSGTSDAENREKLLTLGSLVSNVTSISNRVISGGLDTLEGIGKKTMTILQENDAGLITKRKLLGLDNTKPILSQVLREAKEKSEESERNMKAAQKKLYRKQLHFETLFDDYHGLVHLEALEMLSKQASIKLQSLLMPLSGIALSELQQTISSVSELCELSELDQEDSPDSLYQASELEEKFKTATEDFDIPIDFKDILDTWKENIDWMEQITDGTDEEYGPQKIHDKALQCLAKTSALAVNKYHKLAELLLIKDHHSTVNEADCLIQLTNVFCWHLSGIATLFSGKITNLPSPDPEIQTNSLITNIFLEGSKSTSYIQNAFQLFIPILQFGAV